jgi:hypothetical protein
MSIDWADYEPHVPPYLGPLHELTRRQARESFERLMEAKPRRLGQLTRLLQANGLVIADDDESVQCLNDWFRHNVEPNPDDATRLRNLWYAVVNDIALFLGDVLIRRCPGLRWEMFTSGRRDMAFQRHVIVGFTNVANPKYNVDIDLAVATYGHQIISGEEVDPKFFVAVLHAAAADA